MHACKISLRGYYKEMDKDEVDSVEMPPHLLERLPNKDDIISFILNGNKTSVVCLFVETIIDENTVSYNIYVDNTHSFHPDAKIEPVNI